MPISKVMPEISINDRIAYELYCKDQSDQSGAVIVIEGFIKYKNISFKKYYNFLREEKLKKLNKTQKEC